MIEYTLPNTSEVTIVVYDPEGRQVATPVNDKRPPGNYKLNLEGSDLKSGKYYYMITVNGITCAKKMLMIR